MSNDSTPLSAGALDVLRLGSGPRVVFVHGSVVGPQRTWSRQMELASRWSLVLPHRPGFGKSPPLRRGDFELEAPMIAALLRDGAHLVGHSYGAVIALYVAALVPDRVRSLTVSEPGCMRVAAGDPLVDAQIAGGELLYGRAGEMEPVEFLRLFRGGVGSTNETPEHLTGELLQGARLAMRERPPWEASPPLQTLRGAPFAKLVISGGHSPVFEAVCDAVAEQIDAEREVIKGRRHNIPSTGPPYNKRLHSFMSACERAQPSL
jgi:pimeloyl-ACP methyl ester carboxylesterase